MVTNGRRIVPRIGVIFAGALLGLAMLVSVPAAAGERLTVVELYSAQGCPLCPPAEAYFGELAQRSDLLPLAFHVDYWDYLGWNDRFADAAFSRRQQRYSDRLGLPYVYTPQIIVDGYRQASGSRPDAVEVEIAMASEDRTRTVDISLTRLSTTQLRIEMPATPLGKDVDIVLIGFDAMHRTRIGKGENTGTMLANYHVVRDVRTIANWTGDRFDLTVPLTSRHGETDYCAIIVQEADQGRIIGAARVDMREPGGRGG